MPIFTFHLAEASLGTTAAELVGLGSTRRALGLHHAECMAVMELGSPIVSPARMQLGRLAMFAVWEDEGAVERFLSNTKLGNTLSAGWHVRLELLRRWGTVREFDAYPAHPEGDEPDQPVIAVTLARLRLPEVPRFIRWGKPVEHQVRDHPGVTLALAAIRPPRTVSTFSIWRTQREMVEMVRGQGTTEGVKRHAAAMVERSRRDFHHEFTTLRFHALQEVGAWRGRGNYVPR